MNDSKSNDRSTPNGRYSEWSFVQDHDDEPPFYNGGGVHMGPIPPGLYWLGQAEILVTTGEQAAKNPTVGALTVASRSLGQANSTSPLHLSAISGDEPWHHQIWAIELGKRGYRLRNIGANAHLSLINREAVAELSTPGSSYCEWSISMIPKRNPTDIESFTISPVTDLNSSLATHFQSLFYKVQVKQIQWWHAFWHIEWRINAIRPEALKPLDLEL
ncbi:hypothetical protein FRC03_006151 [Tulasnella sp. 419]|nr:hypothetical protein FRC03_006151 [Tulasnella sp. 419]